LHRYSLFIRQSLPELDSEATTEAFSDDAANIDAVLSSIGFSLAAQLPPVNVDHHSNPFSMDSSEIDLTALVRLRYLHQTKQAETGIRTKGDACNEVGNATLTEMGRKALTERQQVLREFAQIIKQQEDKGVGTGLERKFRWLSKEQNSVVEVDSESNMQADLSGNSANAAAAAKATASKVCNIRLYLTFTFTIVIDSSRSNSLAGRRYSKMLGFPWQYGMLESMP
jgi:hypothetical protein